ncbi:helix-turn-helix transcriptional regulator [Microcoleus sp. K1-B6]|uniref:helix-turn-helix transcriptional regulator n=1 Tax=unclassified Microcoleus TaxID=2642155 RepID=UPI002FCFF6D2
MHTWRFHACQRLRATRELLGMTQEQVIEQLENNYDITMSQQTLCTIEHGKRKVDSERELPAFAAVYSKPIDYFYETLELPAAAPPVAPAPKRRSVVTVDMEALTHRDKLELAAELIHHVLQET